MPKEWVLNSAMNRWQLNFKRNVGAVSDEIRRCVPKNLEEWRNYYYANVYPETHLEALGQRLYVKISEVLVSEIEDITEQDCIAYVKELVVNRTYDGYTTEVQTIYGHLQKELGVKIEPASDEWDRLYNVDFFIRVKGKHIGLQIKPTSHAFITQIHKEQAIQKATHEKFAKKYGGPVFYVYSVKEEGKKKIYNPEVIEEIRQQVAKYNA
jgi:hypothetical protein